MIITTTLSKFFTHGCIGIKRLIAQSTNPTTTRTIMTVIKDISTTNQKGCQCRFHLQLPTGNNANNIYCQNERERVSTIRKFPFCVVVTPSGSKSETSPIVSGVLYSVELISFLIIVLLFQLLFSSLLTLHLSYYYILQYKRLSNRFLTL